MRLEPALHGRPSSWIPKSVIFNLSAAASWPLARPWQGNTMRIHPIYNADDPRPNPIPSRSQPRRLTWLACALSPLWWPRNSDLPADWHDLFACALLGSRSSRQKTPPWRPACEKLESPWKLERLKAALQQPQLDFHTLHSTTEQSHTASGRTSQRFRAHTLVPEQSSKAPGFVGPAQEHTRLPARTCRCNDISSQTHAFRSVSVHRTAHSAARSARSFINS